MTATPREIARGCHNKRVFLDETVAKVGADIARRKHKSKPLRPYKCPNCGFWHLTTQAAG